MTLKMIKVLFAKVFPFINGRQDKGILKAIVYNREMNITYYPGIWCDALRGSVPFVKFKIREKYWQSVTFSKVASCNLIKVTLRHRYFSRFLDCANGTKSHKASHLYKYFDTHCPLLGKCIHRRLAENHCSGNNKKIDSVNNRLFQLLSYSYQRYI